MDLKPNKSEVTIENKLGLIGMPLKGSKSPDIHQMSFELNGIYGQYDLFETEDLASQFNWLMNNGYLGVNVTIPYKEAVIKYLNDLDDSARAMGAVNTIRFEDGKSIGFNTDGSGFLTSLSLSGHEVKGKSILVIGSGGASRGICYALLQSGVEKIWLTNRTCSKSETLVASFKNISPKWQIEAVTLQQAEQLNPDIVVNTTSVGMTPHIEEMPMNPGIFSVNTLICDIVYKPHETTFLKTAIQHGQTVVYGLDMLICQALLAEKIWFDDAIDLPKTLNLLRNKLLETSNT